MPSAAPSRPLWRDRNFTIFWGARTLSVAGDSFALIAVPLLVLHVTGSIALMRAAGQQAGLRDCLTQAHCRADEPTWPPGSRPMSECSSQALHCGTVGLAGNGGQDGC